MRPTTVAVSRRRLTLATGIQIGGRMVGALLGVLVAASLAHTLTRPAFGELSLALTILALAASLADLGISQIAVREMARNPQARARIAGALCLTQLAMGVVLGGVGVGVAFLLMSGTQARIMAVFVMATMPLGAVGALMVAAQARLRPELVIIPALVQNLLWLAAVVSLGAVHGMLSLYGVAALAAGVVQAAVTLVLVTRLTDVTFAGVRALIFELLRIAWPIGVAGMFVTAYYRIDGLLLFHYKGATATAYYSAAYRVLDVLQILPITVAGVLLPLLAGAERHQGGAARVKRLFELAIALLLAAALPVAVCGAILAPKIVGLIYGSHYHASIYLLQLLLPSFVPICLGYVMTGQLILHNMLRPYVAMTFLGAAINVSANVVAIPRYGAPAAAWTTLGTELVVLSGIAVLIRRRLSLTPPFGRALRALAAVAVTGLAVWAVRSQPLPIGIAVAAVVYPPCLFLSRALTITEIRALLERRTAADA